MDSVRIDAGADDPLRRRYRPLDLVLPESNGLNGPLLSALAHDDGVTTRDRAAYEVNGELPGDHAPNTVSTRRDRATYPRTKAATSYAIIGSVYLLMGIFVHYRMNSYPVPKNSHNSLPDEFREENARIYLETITSFGPRVSGSEAHLKAEKYILEVIQEISANKLSNSDIDISLQTVSGDLTIDFINAGLGEFTSIYQNLKNVIAKFSPPQHPNSSVLINCHYDTVADSPGAGDDASSCAVSLEILRALSQSSVDLMHNIIFLFNSAEENMLQTSHGFITGHPWASSIKTFVNLDAAGSGGWEMVFQTGPGHPWLIKAYIEAAPYPHASVIGQEIFQTGLIPADTDFRIFRDYGSIPGIDIAHIKNGYVYHTRNDLPHFIPAGCMQRGGENIMATLILLASSSKLTNPGEDKHGSMVFFDFVGYYIVAYPKRMAALLNLSTSLYVYLAFVKRVLKEGVHGATNVLRPMAMVMLAVFLTWLITLLVPVAMALFLTSIGYSLSYYTHNLNVVWLFILPSVTGALIFHLTLKKTVFKNMDPAVIVVMLQESNLMLWSAVLIILTACDIMSAFLPLLFILCPVFFYTALELCGLKPTSMLFNLVATFIPSLYQVYISYILLMFIIPIMGRAGLEVLPDLVISILCGIPVMMCLPYQIGFVYTHSRVGRVITTKIAVILLGLTAVIFTPAGFPYSYNPLEASSQRALLVHFDRRFHSYSGQVISTDAAVWYQPLDYHGGRMLEMYAPEVLAKAKKGTCDGVYCGRPYLYPILSQMDARKTYDFPAARLDVQRVQVQHLNRELLSDSEVRLTFTISGPSHVTIFISGLPRVNVKKGSCGQKFPVEIFTVPYIQHPTYFVYYSHLGAANSTWEFSMDIEVERSKNINSSLIRIGFSGHHLFGPNQITPDILALEEELPPWMLAVRWSSTYDEYIF